MLWSIINHVVNLTASYVLEHMPDDVTAMEILSNVRAIGNRAFENCIKLEKLQWIMV